MSKPSTFDLVFKHERNGREHVFGVTVDGRVWRLAADELFVNHQGPGPHVKWYEVKQFFEVQR